MFRTCKRTPCTRPSMRRKCLAARICGLTKRAPTTLSARPSRPMKASITRLTNTCVSILKRGVYGTYQHVSEAHLQRYLTEFDFRYSNREARGFDDTLRAEIALQGAKGRRLTYETTRS